MPETLERHDLIEDLEAGCTPSHQWRIGVEHEVFLFRHADRQPAPYEGPDGLRALLGSLTRLGRRPKRERGFLIGLTSEDGTGHSLEPGGQFEYATPPLPDLGAVDAACRATLGEAAAAADELGLGLLPLAFPPEWPGAAMPRTPLSRYGIMRRYMPRVGGRGLDMMHRTCSAQVNLDFADEADMVKKLRVALALHPVAAALTANAPLADGRPADRLSQRGWVWLDVDPARCGLPDFVFEDGMGFERWVDYALDTPMYSVSREGRHVDLAGRSFRDFLAGRLAELPGERPTREDWRAHLNTLMPEARLKGHLEIRGADTGPPAAVAALAAFWTGLLYDGAALEAARSLARGWTAGEREALRREVPASGLATPFRGHTLREVAEDAVAIAREGLGRRAARTGSDERPFLAPLEEVAATGRPPAARWLEAFDEDWDGDLSRAYGAIEAVARR